MKPATKEPEKIANVKPSRETVIRVSHLIKSFGDNEVLKDFSLELRKGESVAVLGKSGSGKSVLIKCIAGLIFFNNGEIKVLGENINRLSHEELDRLRAKIGFLFQYGALYDSMTVRENLEFGLKRHYRHLGDEETEERITEALQNVGLLHTIDMMPSELSGGMQKRIGLARCLVLKPEIMLYDEPTAGLDPITSKEISELIVEVQKKYNTSSLIITHDISCVKIAADRLIFLVNGRCYAEGSYDELCQSDDVNIQAFFK